MRVMKSISKKLIAFHIFFLLIVILVCYYIPADVPGWINLSFVVLGTVFVLLSFILLLFLFHTWQFKELLFLLVADALMFVILRMMGIGLAPLDRKSLYLECSINRDVSIEEGGFICDYTVKLVRINENCPELEIVSTEAYAEHPIKYFNYTGSRKSIVDSIVTVHVIFDSRKNLEKAGLQDWWIFEPSLNYNDLELNFRRAVPDSFSINIIPVKGSPYEGDTCLYKLFFNIKKNEN